MKKLLLLSTFALGLFTFSFSQEYGWKDISANVPGDPDFSSVFFVSDNEGWISVSSGPEIYHTTDGGETFEIQTTQTSLEAIHMINSQTGFCGGASGFVYNTGDGGTNWGFLGTMAALLTDMDFVSASQGYACGDGGAVFSIAGGLTNLNSGLASDLSGISSPSVDNVWVCGGNNIVYYNGSTFAFQTGPVGTYNSIFFINDQEGWVVGTAGLIAHTVNGGNTWSSQTSPSSNSLYDVFFLDTEVGWAVGSQGTILYTANGGDTWTIEGAGLTTNFLRGVHFTSPTNGYVVGNGKTLLKYTDISGIGDRVETIPFEIFPNPAQNEFKVSSLPAGQAGSGFKVGRATVEIFDLHGSKLLEKQIPKGTEEFTVDVSHLNIGLYFCRIRTEKGSVTKKLMIQK